MMKSVPFFAASLLVLLACNSGPNKKNAVPADDTTAIVQVQNVQIEKPDSIELMFYPDPADTKAYSRLVVSDTALVGAVYNNLLQDTIARTECPHDVKMFFIRKGEVYKTVYGATSDSCRYFAYAINSNPHYTPMQQRSFVLIDSLRKLAR